MDYSQLAHDFGQRYAGTFVFFQQKNQPEELVYVKKCFQDGDGFPMIEFSSDELGVNTVRFDTDSTIIFRRPKIGVFQFGKSAYLINRMPKQQFSKGVSSVTYSIDPVHRKFTGASTPSGSWTKALKASYTPEFFSWKEALKMLASGKYSSVALDRRYSLVLGFTPDSHTLFHYSFPVGKVSKDGTCDFKAGEAGTKFSKLIQVF